MAVATSQCFLSLTVATGDRFEDMLFRVARKTPLAALILLPFAAHAVLTHAEFVPIGAQTCVVTVTALSHGALYGGLGLLFGLSLRPGRQALVSRLALCVEPCPTAGLISYTRGVTWLWFGFCAAQLFLSGCLLAAAPLPVWSMFVNVLDLPLAALTFIAEYRVRCWRFRDMPTASLVDTVCAFARRDALLAAPARFGEAR
jgi:uncharacterized membrane protein